MKKVIIIGTFPPPVHGVATINQKVSERLLRDGYRVQIINTSPQKIKHIFFSRVLRLGIFLPIWLFLLKTVIQNDMIYLSLSGGWGQVYDLITIFFCRMRGISCVLHHHSVAYLVKKRLITTLLMQLAGEKAIHIVLCQHMKKKLVEKYGRKRVTLLSNAAFLQLEKMQRSRNKIRTIGYLSNITSDKGGWEIVEFASEIRQKGWALKIKLAGDCQDKELQNAIQKAQILGDLEWIGPVYDKDKDNFLSSIDIFLFPTKYENEAEPLVVWEALLSGVPVIAYDRGCISGQVGDAGKIIQPDTDFVESATKLIEAWMNTPKIYQKYVKAAQNISKNAKILAETQWEEFILRMRTEVSFDDQLSEN